MTWKLRYWYQRLWRCIGMKQFSSYQICAMFLRSKGERISFFLVSVRTRVVWCLILYTIPSQGYGRLLLFYFHLLILVWSQNSCIVRHVTSMHSRAAGTSTAFLQTEPVLHENTCMYTNVREKKWKPIADSSKTFSDTGIKFNAL